MSRRRSRRVHQSMNALRKIGRQTEQIYLALESATLALGQIPDTPEGVLQLADTINEVLQRYFPGKNTKPDARSLVECLMAMRADPVKVPFEVPYDEEVSSRALEAYAGLDSAGTIHISTDQPVQGASK